MSPFTNDVATFADVETGTEWCWGAGRPVVRDTRVVEQTERCYADRAAGRAVPTLQEIAEDRSYLDGLDDLTLGRIAQVTARPRRRRVA